MKKKSIAEDKDDYIMVKKIFYSPERFYSKF